MPTKKITDYRYTVDVCNYCHGSGCAMCKDKGTIPGTLEGYLVPCADAEQYDRESEAKDTVVDAAKIIEANATYNEKPSGNVYVEISPITGMDELVIALATLEKVQQ